MKGLERAFVKQKLTEKCQFLETLSTLGNPRTT